MHIRIFRINSKRDASSLSGRSYHRTIEIARKIDSRIYDTIFDGEVPIDELSGDSFSRAVYNGHYSEFPWRVSDVIGIGTEKFLFVDRFGMVEIDFEYKRARRVSGNLAIVMFPGIKAYSCRIDPNSAEVHAIFNGRVRIVRPFFDRKVVALTNGNENDNEFEPVSAVDIQPPVVIAKERDLGLYADIDSEYIKLFCGK